MPVRINREELLRSLESVRPGLATQKETVEQSSCVVFQDGRIHSYNDEIACSAPSPLGNKIQGAIKASKFLEHLAKFPDEEIVVDVSGGQFKIKGAGGRKSGLYMESEVILPIENVETPETWSKLPPDFGEAISLVVTCGQGNKLYLERVCVHVTKKFIEASDDVQLCRWRMELPISSDELMIRSESIKHVASLGMVDMAETPAWLHFRNAVGVTLACRKILDTYEDMSAHLNVEGESIQLPKGLVEAAKRADTFSSEFGDVNQVKVKLAPNQPLIIRSEGVSGWHEEPKKVNYSGPEIEFLISPKLLSKITQDYGECVVSQGAMKVSGNAWEYVACLAVPTEREPEELVGASTENEE